MCFVFGGNTIFDLPRLCMVFGFVPKEQTSATLIDILAKIWRVCVRVCAASTFAITQQFFLDENKTRFHLF